MTQAQQGAPVKFFKNLFSSTKEHETKASEQPEADVVTFSYDDLSDAEKANLALREASQKCLDRHWNSIGTSEQDVLGYAISPSFMGGPDWPSTRQAYRVVRRGDSIIIATEGMSDPFDGVEGLGNGFEMEMFIETSDIPEQARGLPEDVDPFQRSWAFELLKHLAADVANAGGITGKLERYGSMSYEIPGFSQSHYMCDQLPAHFVTEDDMTGMLLGAPEADFPTRIEDMPLSAVKLVCVTLITAAELEYIRKGGQTARDDLIVRLKAAGFGHACDLKRTSVI
jgi:Suppressor of fused protein (SUFU)